MSDHINVPIRRVKDWTTHMGVLVKALSLSQGTVLELGAGLYSTPILHWICKEQNRKLITYENDPLFHKLARSFRSPNHKIKWVDSWDDMDFKSRYGVVFIDHHPEGRRGTDVINFKDSAEYIIVHDSNRVEKYNLEEAFDDFKYVHTWKECKPWVTIASNFKDLKEFE